jgi:hypothetical protein
MTSATSSANRSARQAARSRPVRIGARIGIAAYGLTHLLVAWLALRLALGGGGQRADQSGAFQALASGTGGGLLLWVLVAGFVAVALWRLGEAIWGYAYVSDRTENIRRRAASGWKAVLFAVLAVLAGRAATSGSAGGGGGQKATAGVLGLPGGQFLVGLVGLGIIVAGAVLAWRSWEKRFVADMDLPLDLHARGLAVRTGQIGGVAKGVALGLVGLLVVLAAVQARPEQAAGLDAALRALAARPYGIVLLVAVALGLAAYGVFCAFDARYHRV